MSEPYDVVVLGAGPAGASAAIRARSWGLSVLVIDESPFGGGQVYRAPSAAIENQTRDVDALKGEILRRELRNCGATLAFGERVWSTTPDLRIATIGPNGPATYDGRTLIVATGALERHIPVPNWTLPGVISLAAATILLKSHRVLPGRRTIVAGSGPLLLLVAAKILEAGGGVAAVVDASPRSAWFAELPHLALRPDLLLKGTRWLMRLLAARVPMFAGHAVVRVDGNESVSSATISAIDGTWAPKPGAETTIEGDALCLGYGLMPSTDVTRLLNATHRFDPDHGGWTVSVDADMQTSVPGVFAAGDGAGVFGADAAPRSGTIAALGAAKHLGRTAAPQEHRRARAAWPRSQRFGAAMTRLATPGSRAHQLIGDDALVCRCEGLTRATLDFAIQSGSRTFADLKAATRCGMGPCGGRVCGEAAALLIAAQTGSDRERIGLGTSRPPLRPVPLAAMAGAFSYDDLPIPEPAPL